MTQPIEFPPALVYVDLYKTKPSVLGKKRHQPWRWRARSGANNEILASGEAYANRGDALQAIDLLFGTGANVRLREKGADNQTLRLATT